MLVLVMAFCHGKTMEEEWVSRKGEKIRTGNIRIFIVFEQRKPSAWLLLYSTLLVSFLIVLGQDDKKLSQYTAG